MALKKKQKAEIIESVKEKIAEAKSLVLVNFHGLNVAATTALRRALKEQGIGYTVVKKTLLRRALPEMPALGGEVAIAYGADLFLPVKGIYEFQQKIKAGIKILGGIFGGEFKSAEEMIKIAQIPAREALYGQLFGLLVFPFQSLVVALNQISKNKSQ
ncbi:MAG: 50S ribosomal protein L10 [Candidatus Vogelbacteria bacterium]|nr:50S ribosomal protein L10 [Candidatus Vogelbacteria bacterium]